MTGSMSEVVELPEIKREVDSSYKKASLVQGSLQLRTSCTRSIACKTLTRIPLYEKDSFFRDALDEDSLEMKDSLYEDVAIEDHLWRREGLGMSLRACYIWSNMSYVNCVL